MIRSEMYAQSMTTIASSVLTGEDPEFANLTAFDWPLIGPLLQVLHQQQGGLKLCTTLVTTQI